MKQFNITFSAALIVFSAQVQAVQIDAVAGVSIYATGEYGSLPLINIPGGQSTYSMYSKGAPSSRVNISYASNTYDVGEGAAGEWTSSGYPVQTIGAAVNVGFEPQPFLYLTATPREVRQIPLYRQVIDESGGSFQEVFSSVGVRLAEVSASLTYEFSVKSAPSTIVPVHFSGLMSFISQAPSSDSYLIDIETGLWKSLDSYGRAGVHISFNGSGGDSLVGADVSLQNSFYRTRSQSGFDLGTWTTLHNFNLSAYLSDDSSLSLSGDPIVDGETWLSSFSSNFSGTIYMVTDEHGFSDGSVSIFGDARGGATFIDPLLTIDSAFLLSNPNTSISLPAGIGNSPVQSIPEPSTYLLFCVGLGMMLMRKARSFTI